MFTLRYAAVTFVVVALAGCTQAPAGPQFTKSDVEAITKTIQELTARFNAKDPEKVAELFSANAVLMPPNQSTARARDAVKQFYVGRFAEGATDLELEPRDITGVGNLAYATGDFRLNLARPGLEPQRDRGKFVWIFRKTNERWLIEYVVFNSDFAARMT
jgi:uncharacterized protein (TIGR02246 family)